jgi:hypothetical protein
MSLYLREKKKTEAEIDFFETIPYYNYTTDTIRRSILLVTTALTSLRGATKSLQIFSDLTDFSIPSHTSIQNWILQYGLYQLKAPIEQRSDWIFILDHTIEFGSQKCLLILGTTQEKLAQENKPIAYEDLRVLHIEVSYQTSGKQINNILEQLIQKTGLPIQVVSDGGSDIKKGIKLICQSHGSIMPTYDITHRCGIILKDILEFDIQWNRFLKKYTDTKRKCVHSQFAFIAPKKLKDKSRWVNLDTSVDWAVKVIEFRDNGLEQFQNTQLQNNLIKTFNSIFGWIDEFKESIQRWRNILEIISVARDEIKTNGLRIDSLDRFSNKLQNLNLRTIPSYYAVISKLQTFFKEQTSNINPGQKFLGSSDIIESVFAKYKSFSARTPMKGIGKTILTIPVFLSSITPQNVANALMNVNVNMVNEWIKQNIGISIFSQRKKAFANCMKK